MELVVRQQSGDADQNTFIEILPRIRNGQVTEEDWRFLRDKVEATQQRKENLKYKNGTHLFMDRASVNEHNKIRLMELNMPVAPLIAQHSHSKGRYADDDYFSGLTNDLYLSINSQVVLTSNEWTDVGLVNGASGIVKDIIYPNKAELNILEELPDILLIDFDNYSGPSFFEDHESKSCIPIYCKTSYSKYHNCTRKQMPIKLNYASTIHKAQGATLTSGIIDLGDKETSLGLAFVALTRFKSIHDFLISSNSLTFRRFDNLKNHASLKG